MTTTTTTTTIKQQKLPLHVIQQLPKAELHCHLDGSVRVSTIIDLAQQQGVTLPSMDHNELTRMITVDDGKCESLEQYLQGFGISLSVMQTKAAISRIMYEVCEDAYRDGVRYIEVRFSPILHVQNGLSLAMVMEAVCEGQMVAELKLQGMIARIIVCGMRQMSSEVSLALAEIAWRYKSRGVVGFDLAGPEFGFSSKLHKEAFELIRKKLINCTLHSGEASDWRSVYDSIRFCGAQRIGHGVRMAHNDQLVQFVVNKRIAVEVCLTSNLQTKAIDSYAEHPIRQYFDRGMVVVPCTDNVTVSGTTLSQEYEKIQNLFDFSVKDIVRMIDHGFRSSFIDHALRQRVRLEAMNQTMQVLMREGYDISELSCVRSHLNIGLKFTPLPDALRDVLHGGVHVSEEGNGNNNNDHTNKNNIQLVGLNSDGNESLASLYEHRVEEWNQVIQQLPKCDNNTTFNGSVSIATLWSILQTAKNDPFVVSNFELLHVDHIDEEFETMDHFAKFIQLEPDQRHTKRTIIRGIQAMSLLLQTQEQLERGLEDIFENAVKDNVKYLELYVRPSLHIKRGLSLRQVVDIILTKRDELQLGDTPYSTDKIRCNIVLSVDNLEDGIEQMRQMAMLVIEYRTKVVGFAFAGLNADKESYSREEIEVFNLLKKHQINVSITSGFREARSVVTAISDCGATRLSGCYAIHTERQIMDYMARNRIPVEFGVNDTLKYFLGMKSGFMTKKNKEEIVGLYLEMGIIMTPCSFDLTLYRKTRSHMLSELSTHCKLDINQLLLLLYNSYRSSFADYWYRVGLQEKTYVESLKILKENNFRYSGRKLFVPN